MEDKALTDKLYPIAELFDSVQGEGLFQGTRMYFIRLAGCNVGKPFPKERYEAKKNSIIKQDGNLYYALPIYTEQCTLYDGRTFECDTNYRVKERLSLQQLVEKIPSEITHVCLTGGEPFIHDLNPLVTELNRVKIQVHIETSGTLPLSKAFPSVALENFIHDYNIWITLSPKVNVLPEMIDRADEIKLLVDENFDATKLPPNVLTHKLVWLHPINYERRVKPENVKRIMTLQQKFPSWRIGLQLHKVLEEYIGEKVL